MVFVENMENNNILLSIKPKILREIEAGEKKYEFRKNFPNLNDAIFLRKPIFIYESKPTMKIVGKFEVSEFYNTTFEELATILDLQGDYKKRIKNYFGNQTENCIAMKIEELQIFKNSLHLYDIRKITEGFWPGQSYRFIPPSLLSACLSLT